MGSKICVDQADCSTRWKTPVELQRSMSHHTLVQVNGMGHTGLQALFAHSHVVRSLTPVSRGFHPTVRKTLLLYPTAQVVQS